MSKIQIDKIAPNKSNHVTVDGDLIVTGKINGVLPNQLSASTPMVYATAWQRAASNFEFVFSPPTLWSMGNPTIGKNPYSTDINPRTGNAYIVDYQNSLIKIVSGNRIAWMDEDTSSFFDWNFTYVNPYTLQDQTWEPKGMILPNTNGISPWNSTISYIVGNKVTYNGFIWSCNIANSNEIPTTIFPATDYWQNSGVPVGTGFNYGISPLYSIFDFNVSSYPAGQAYFYLNGSVNSGVNYWGYDSSARLQPIIQGKMPIITLNTFMNSSNSNRYPTPFDAQHQMDLLDYVNTGMGLNPNTLPKIDMINLGSNINRSIRCNVSPWNSYSSGYLYGSAMTEYVRKIRANSEPITANAKILIQGNCKYPVTTQLPLLTEWIYNFNNPSDQNKGFIHGFYNSVNNPTGVDFDYITLHETPLNTISTITNYSNARNNLTITSWSWCMGPSQYILMRNTIADCKTALSLYNKQNRIKYFCRFLTSTTFGTSSSPYSHRLGNFCWAAQTGVFMALVLAMTDPDFMGFQHCSIFEITPNCALSLLYDTTDSFGLNTTDIFDYTSVGWMYRRIFQYFKPGSGALSFTRILKLGGLGLTSSQYGIGLTDYCMGVYINSTGNGDNKPHVIILCNYSPQSNQSIDIDVSLLIDQSWTNVQFAKWYTPLSIYEPINFYSAGNYITVQEIAPYTPTPAQILSTPLLPTEYLIITAE